MLSSYLHQSFKLSLILVSLCHFSPNQPPPSDCELPEGRDSANPCARLSGHVCASPWMVPGMDPDGGKWPVKAVRELRRGELAGGSSGLISRYQEQCLACQAPSGTLQIKLSLQKDGHVANLRPSGQTAWVYRAIGWRVGSRWGQMQEKTVCEESLLVPGMLWNCQEYGWEQRPPGTTSPKEEGKRPLPRWPQASEHAAKRRSRSLVTGH